jgi:hypothetical protein
MNNERILITDDIFFFFTCAYLKVLDSEFNDDNGSLLFLVCKLFCQTCACKISSLILAQELHLPFITFVGPQACIDRLKGKLRDSNP